MNLPSLAATAFMTLSAPMPFTLGPAVIPAKGSRHSRESGNPVSWAAGARKVSGIAFRPDDPAGELRSGSELAASFETLKSSPGASNPLQGESVFCSRFEQVTPSVATIPAQPRDVLKCTVALSLWYPLMNGDVTVQGFPVKINQGFEENVEPGNERRLAFGGHVEVAGDLWVASADLYRMVIEEDEGIQGGEVGTSTDQAILDLCLSRRIGQWSLSEKRETVVELLGGARWNGLQIDLDLKAPGLSGDRDADEEWWDLLIGARARIDLTERFHLIARGDVGGFGLGASSDSTWQLFGELDYNFGRWTAGLGYRALSIDYDHGSGANALVYDVVIHGPVAGLGYRF